jgi:hypothetical protein
MIKRVIKYQASMIHSESGFIPIAGAACEQILENPMEFHGILENPR